MKLTTRQQEILDFIRQCIHSDGLPPTRAEIVEQFGFASPNAAQCHLQALARHGAIELHPGTARGIVLNRLAEQHGPDTPAPRSTLSLPVIGRVAAGSPLLAVENREDDMVVDAARFHPRPDYALRVHGESMTGAGIQDGDLLLVHRSPEARSGQVVVARINEEVTVKRLKRRGQAIWLESENPAFDPIQVRSGDEFAVEGLGVGVVRSGID